MVKVSIVIPVYNQWELTRACLRSIKATMPPGMAEVILVDNASTDVTYEAAPFLGRQLFGDSFIYIRNEENRNFAGASNQGARTAKGQYLVFLNNDTVARPGWCERLIEDFGRFSDIAGTGPLLLYPEKPLVGQTVQHLGVVVSVFGKISHLYEGVPLSSPLARKRRFFQIITAACMMMPRELFLEAGGFDEGYVNGFEDVDLCARLSSQGWRFTVNPEAEVIHYQGQSQGRSAHEAQNSARFVKRTQPLLKPDKEKLLAEDGLLPGLNEWQIQVPQLPGKLTADIADSMVEADKAKLVEILLRDPYWRDGWLRLLPLLTSRELAEIAGTIFKLVPEPAAPVLASRDAHRTGDRKKALYWFMTASVFCLPEAQYLEEARNRARYAQELQAYSLEEKYGLWLKAAPQFFHSRLAPFVAEFGKLGRELEISPDPGTPWAFALRNA